MVNQKIKNYRVEIISLVLGIAIGATVHLVLFQRKPTLRGIAKACAVGAIASVSGAQAADFLKKNKTKNEAKL